jgi:hypothetical protein
LVIIISNKKGLEIISEQFVDGGLQESKAFVEDNITVHSFVETVYKCGDIYSSSEIFVKNRSSTGKWNILFYAITLGLYLSTHRFMKDINFIFIVIGLIKQIFERDWIYITINDAFLLWWF